MARLVDLRRTRAALNAERASTLRSQPSVRASSFTGAAHNRLTGDWVMSGVRSADGDLRTDLRTLRNRARDFARNSPHAARFLRMVEENVIGAKGIRLQAQITGAAGKPDRKANGLIEEAWADWCQPENCSANRRLDFPGLCRLAARTMAQDGEVLVRMLEGFDNPHGFAVQLIDADLLDEEYNRPAGDGQNEVRMGVEVDAWGGPVAYWLWTQHPGDFQPQRRRKRERIPASEIIHLGLPGRIEQTRFPTWFHPVLFRGHMLDAFAEAAVTAARLGASTVGMWEQSATDGLPPNPNGFGEAGSFEVPAEPGQWGVAPAGYKLSEWSPDYPNIEYAAFEKAMLRGVASGLSASYNTLAGDLEGVNYSSLREGKLTERETWKVVQALLCVHLCRPVYERWRMWALTTGRLQLPSRNTNRWGAHRWMPRGWPWVDPLKDIEADARAIEERFTSRTRVCAERGVDYEEVLAELAAEQEMERDYGVEMTAEETVSRANARAIIAAEEAAEGRPSLRLTGT